MTSPVEYVYADEEIEDELNEIYPPVSVCGYEYDAGSLLKEIDPVAFRCVVADMPARYACSNCDSVYGTWDEANECCAEEELEDETE